MSNPVKGPCPHCGAEIYVRITVSKVQVSQPPAAERNPGGWQPTNGKPPAAPVPAPTNGSRPVCEDCGSTGAILEQVVKKPGRNQGRLFTAYTCSNEGCPSFGDTISGTFRFLSNRQEPVQV